MYNVVGSRQMAWLIFGDFNGTGGPPIHHRTKNMGSGGHRRAQNDEKKVSVAVPMESSSSNEPAGAAKEDSIAETHHLDGYAQKLKNSKPKQKLMAEENAKNSGSAEKKSLVSVPWRVPHNKRGEKHPGFNFDYSPPKTHPPSHN
ncbi:hypothetical protein GH714_018819 [Hevea brasiliensis]|uniref:Uncharacterized protein n=1 Tax=Hevea brasiliensis TaxID=3981 RepID=A0A6A6LPW7_HEVBR|nr:hypothetical protein GH714_018745 [Hevea brasiliensis]KAF2303496.1 hypothetical protein GH714_018819 [Hevea brasiliensis]